MINEKEILISNKSYINKDFGVIYPEVINLVKILTNRYDPETSNESDPGIVLLKILSFIADKNNYNIDKNALETFMVSATQISSMRKLCDMLGYHMNYYIAPEAKMTIMYTGTDFNSNYPITLNALETVFGSSDETNSLQYILTQTCQIARANDTNDKTYSALQGELRTLKVNTNGTETSTDGSNSLIQLENLDDNNRIYFPETNVAQNGVFVNIVDDNEFWTRVDNLNYHGYPDKVFKFGYDSTRNLPYIEFPTYISNLIGDGLSIRYIITLGSEGNVSAKVLNELASTSFNFNVAEGVTYNKDNIYVRNNSSVSNGLDPETINEAYINFKKIIGTFDTLVTCRDYANAIYEMYSSDSNYPLVSNVQVCDRRSDFNYSKRVVSYDNNGELIKNKTNASNLSAYDLCCYPLYPIYEFNRVESFNQSFKPLTASGETLTYTIKDNLESSKSISHDYKLLDDTDYYLFKNMVKLTAQIITKYKVTVSEQVEILNNIKNDLMATFNARNVDYGVEIPYDSLYNCIKNADERISQIILTEPTLKTRVMTRSGDQFDLWDNDGGSTINNKRKAAYVKLLAQNILNGNISLFEFDTDFNYELGEYPISGISMVNKYIENIETHLDLTLSSTPTQLYKNEIIQIVSPNRINEQTYPAYCYYRLEANSDINSGDSYALGENDKIYVSYTDKNGQEICDVYSKPFIVKPTGGLDLKVNPSSTKTRLLPDKKTTAKFGMMPEAANQVEVSKVNSTKITSKTPCYWITQNYSLTIPSDGKYMLKENEYFFYTDLAHTQLIALGSGTSLEFPTACRGETYYVDKVSIENVLENGFSALENKWYVFSFSSSQPFKVTENEIITLTEGDTLKQHLDEHETPITLNNTLTQHDNVTLEYTLGEEEPVIINTNTLGYMLRSRLDINVSKNEPQVINDGFEGNHTRQRVIFSFAHEEGTLPPDDIELNTSGQYFNLNASTQLIGGETFMGIDVRQDLSEDVEPVYVYPVSYPYSVYCYQEQKNDGEFVNPTLNVNVGRNENGYATYNISEITPSAPLTFNIPKIGNEHAVIMLHAGYLNDNDALSISATNCTIKYYNVDGAITTLRKGINVIELTPGSGTPSITISNPNDASGILTIGTLDFYSGYNTALKIDEFEQLIGDGGVDTALSTAIRDDDFYYNCKIDNSRIIETKDMSSPYTLYDANNRANKMTLSQIDFSTGVYDIEISRGSRL